MVGRIVEWWNGLDYNAHDWFIYSGLLMLFVAGMSVGVVGAVNFAALEPLAHLGFSVAIAGLLGAIFTAMARLA